MPAAVRTRAHGAQCAVRGFSFTTFSYALSLLRPDIIHELELTKHGFMPILMPSTFCPKEDGDYLLLGQDHGENLKEIGRHSKRDADAYEAFNHDVSRVCQAMAPVSGFQSSGTRPVTRKWAVPWAPVGL